MSLLSRLKRDFPPAIVQRGASYYTTGRVREMRSRGPGAWTVKVDGSMLYDVALQVAGRRLQASCDCPFVDSEGALCKHIWAAMMAVDKRNVLPRSLEGVDLVDYGGDDLEDDEDDDDDDEEYQPPSKPAPWLRQFPTRPSTVASANRDASRIPHQIGYLLNEGPYYNTGGAWLQIVGRSRKLNGEWGTWKSFRMPMAQLDELEPFDRETIGLLQGRLHGELAEATVSISEEMSAWWIERLARAQRLLVLRGGQHLTVPWDERPWRFEPAVSIDEQGDRYRIGGSLTCDTESVPLELVRRQFDGVVMLDDLVFRLDLSRDERAWFRSLLEHGSIEVPRADRERLRAALIDAPLLGVPLPEEFSWDEVEIEPVPRLVLRDDPHDLEHFAADLMFVYDDRVVEAADPVMRWKDGETLIRRKLRSEREHAGRLEWLTRRSGAHRIPRSGAAAVAEALASAGWEVMFGETELRTPDSLDVEIRSGIDWFDLKAGVSFGDEVVTLPAIFRALDRKDHLLTLADGTHAFLPSEWTERLAELSRFAKPEGDALRFKPSQALFIDGVLEQTTHTFDDSFAALRDRMRDTEPRPVHELDSFRGELRPYQREGLGWLQFCRETGIGGCLADDMGLGKTVQMLAFLQMREREGGRPVLVVAPRSLLFNWSAEAARFAPDLRVALHHGPERAVAPEELDGLDVILTTYGTLRRDAKLLGSITFDAVILDEAQAIKNPASQVSKVARSLDARERYALTGTPVENHLGELWSLFDFLNPGMLGSSRTFQRTFVGKGTDPKRLETLARAVRPFILRRTKEQVAPELPSRTEQTLYCELTGKQKKQYDELRDYYRAAVLGKVEKSGLAKSKIQILEALLRLRQAACHPGLIDGRKRSSSAKLDLLFEELDEVIDSGHRALVFSQFTTFLAFARERLDSQGIAYCYLDGKTRNRDEVVNRFQSEDGPPLFLISLKAGGLGLNLTNADYVFLLDPWWNPAVEAQAIDRAHRIGQARPVVAHRLIARDTVEEKILQLQETKRELAESIITADNSILRKLDVEDLRMLLS